MRSFFGCVFAFLAIGATTTQASTLELILRSGEQEAASLLKPLFKSLEKTESSEAAEFFMHEMVYTSRFAESTLAGGRSAEVAKAAYSRRLAVFVDSMPGLADAMKKEITDLNDNDIQLLATASRRMMIDPTAGFISRSTHYAARFTSDTVFTAATLVPAAIEGKEFGSKVGFESLAEGHFVRFNYDKGTFQGKPVTGQVWGKLKEISSTEIYVQQASQNRIGEGTKKFLVKDIWPSSIYSGGSTKDLANKQVRGMWGEQQRGQVSRGYQFVATLVGEREAAGDVRILDFISADGTKFELPSDRVLWLEEVVSEVGN